MSPVFEDLTNNPRKQTAVRLRLKQLQRLKAIGKAEKRSFNAVVEHFLLWAEEDWRKETTPQKLESFRSWLAKIEEANARGEDLEDEEEPESEPAEPAKKVPGRRASKK
jgi:uncharacterized protein YdaU (DUF1376 family)